MNCKYCKDKLNNYKEILARGYCYKAECIKKHKRETRRLLYESKL